MKAVIQRVTRAAVTLQETGERRAIGPGLMVLLGVGHEDTSADAEWLAQKIASLRIFSDEAGKMNLGLTDVPGGAMLIVSQFTLFGDCRKGRRPSFIDAGAPSMAIPLYEEFVGIVRGMGIPVETGEFGADMLVELANDGPVTLIVETPPKN
jgi:D-tyrosyl-tRNA(Tyr) deacylase